MKKNEKTIKTAALKVLEMEAKAVIDQKNSISDCFVDVVNLFYKCKGRIIVSGVGKSAIVATKIVATFNSTGTPSIFMHSSDAVHGDLGMIKEEDIVMFVSKSGNTPEVKRILPLIKDMGNTVVVMVANKDSYLALHSEYVIYTPIEREACPNNLAPTTSTTVQMAMGDAIAMSLATLRHFSADDFAKLHPGGSLGKKLYMKVEDVFDKTNRPWVAESESIQNTIINISSHRLGATVVLGGDKSLKGIITDGDVRRMVEKNHSLDKLKAVDIMSSDPKTIDIKALAVNALNIMEEHQITSVVVLSDNRYMGLIHIHDIMKEGIG